MAQYTRSIRTSATGSGVAAVELIVGAKPITVKEIGIAIVNATASTFALGRPAAIGITPTSPVALLSPRSVYEAAKTKLAVAWGTGPTIPAAFFRQCSLPATAGAERIWELGYGISVPASGSLILWTLTTVSIADVYFVIEE
jgi:hypothetical protein